MRQFTLQSKSGELTFQNKRPPVDAKVAKNTIDKAKHILMKKHDLTEPEAYEFIRKTAMDYLLTKVEIAQGIIDNNAK